MPAYGATLKPDEGTELVDFLQTARMALVPEHVTSGLAARWRVNH